jgi:hypothetical protein
VAFEDGSTVFAKVATTPLTRLRIRDESYWYRMLHGDFLPRMLGFEDAPDRPILLLEDLSHAHWPPPWHLGEIERVQETLARMAAGRPLPEELPRLEDERNALSGWAEVSRDTRPFLSLGLCSADWLAGALPRLIQAEAGAALDGEDLVHCDLRSDNICLLPERVAIVDWDMPRRGNRMFDLAFFAPSLRLEGGPLPDQLVPGDVPLAALVSGFFAADAGLPPIPDAPRVRWIQLRQLRIALPWVARALALPPPDLPWCSKAIAEVALAHEQGRIDSAHWHAQIEELLCDSYLSSDDPRGQSGKSGDEAEWRWSRELALDALPAGGTLLDVGCANGYLMESFQRWGKERGISVEPYGIEISSRMATLARRRLPQWADRIWIGNVLDWSPPRRFDLVHTGLDYVPRRQRRELVERLLREFLVPGGRIVLRAERVTSKAPDLVEQLRELGIKIGGVIERVEPQSGTLRRTAWISHDN